MRKERFFVMDVWKSTWLDTNYITCYGYERYGGWETYYTIRPKLDVGSLLGRTKYMTFGEGI